MIKKLFGLAVLLAVVFAAGWLGRDLLGSAPPAPEVATAPQSKVLPYKAGPFRLNVTVDPEAPEVGENTLTVRLENAAGEPVSGATFKAVAEMPAMGAMPAMQAPVQVEEVEPGLYRGIFDLSMEGAWPLALAIEKEGLGEVRLGFDLATGRKGLELGSGGSKVDTAVAPEAAAEAGLPFETGPYRFDVSVDPAAPEVGENVLTVQLASASGQPMVGVNINAIAEMPAMGAMPAMQAPAELEEVQPGIYQGIFDLSMEGAWPLTLKFNREGLPPAIIGFDMATGRSGLALSSGANPSRAGMAGMAEEAPPGTIRVDARRRQIIGLEIGTAEIRDLLRDIRAVGRVTFDETRLSDIALKYDAWVGDVKADFEGAMVKKGDILFTVYSPELFTAQQEYLEALSRSKRTGNTDFLESAQRRLEFLDVPDAAIKELKQRRKPLEYVPIYAPRNGIVVDKNVVEGTALKAGMPMMRIADLSEVWVEADVYEADIPLIEEGMSAAIKLPYLPGETFEGRVDYIYPYLAGTSRTGRVRLSLPNPEGALKPDMYAEARLKVALDDRLVVPEDAVIVAGDTRLVFEDLGDGRLAPRKVKTGRRAEGYVEILEGLNRGDRVVASGNFLIASESRLKSGVQQW